MPKAVILTTVLLAAAVLAPSPRGLMAGAPGIAPNVASEAEIGRIYCFPWMGRRICPRQIIP